jgi:peptidoglycan hydrolase-like protein with peptidoglycan-binding domain
MHWPDQTRRWQRAGLCGLLCLTVHGLAVAQTESTTSPPPAKPAHTSAAAKKSKKHTTTGHTTSKRASSHKSTISRSKKVATKHGQQGIDATRTREIQTALIRQNYMQGEPTGDWDNSTQAALRRYQADHGWQSKTVPDSRALIRLGLGPSSDHLLNPESAMTTPAPPAAGDPKAATKPNPPENNLPQN